MDPMGVRSASLPVSWLRGREGMPPPGKMDGKVHICLFFLLAQDPLSPLFDIFFLRTTACLLSGHLLWEGFTDHTLTKLLRPPQAPPRPTDSSFHSRRLQAQAPHQGRPSPMFQILGDGSWFRPGHVPTKYRLIPNYSLFLQGLSLMLPMTILPL